VETSGNTHRRGYTGKKSGLFKARIGPQESGRHQSTAPSGLAMAKAYYSIVTEHSADEIWKVVRPFDHYAWAGVKAEIIIEDGKAGDQVGAIRRIVTADKIMRQILLSHSDLERSYTYAFCDPVPLPVRNYVATIRVTPVTEAGQSFVEWWATFDCAADEQDRWISYFEKEGFAEWLSALGEFMGPRNKV
jgi:hypothetical protein